MADASIVHIGENSPEEVAFKLMKIVANLEKKELVTNPNPGWAIADRKWLLDTYAECSLAVKNPASRR